MDNTSREFWAIPTGILGNTPMGNLGIVPTGILGNTHGNSGHPYDLQQLISNRLI